MGDSPGDRLASFRKSLGMNQRTFASTLGVSPGRIGSMETDADPPTRGFLQKISQRYHISADWLLNGHGAQFHAPTPGFQGRTTRIEPADADQVGLGEGDLKTEGRNYAFVKQMRVSVSAGMGLIPVEDTEVDRMALPLTWFQRNRINSDVTVLVHVHGDSMAPTIPDGCLVLLHIVEKTIDKAGVYAFTRGDEAFIKRLVPSEVSPDGRLTSVAIIADNPAYPTQVISGKALNDLRIVGRVRAVFSVLD